LSKSIGIVNAEQEFVTLIPVNTPLPVRRNFTFSNYLKNQKEVFIAIWEGVHQHQDEKKEVEEEKEGGEEINIPQRPINIPEEISSDKKLEIEIDGNTK
jgi:hypothetical protein